MMKKRYVNILCLFLAVLLCFAACNASAPELPAHPGPAEPVTLRIVYDGNVFPGPQGMRTYLKDLAEDFEAQYENVEIVLEEYAATDEASIDSFREDLTQQAEDKCGPDIYLLSTGATTSPHAEVPLFVDVNQAMQEGWFLDIDEYYMADRELTEGLNEQVMSAGVVNGFRYTLPLRFDYPVAAVNLDAFREAGLQEQIFDKGINEVLYWIAETQNPELAAASNLCLQANWMYFFPELLDYDRGEVLLSQGELSAFLSNWYAYHQLALSTEVESGDATFDGYISMKNTWLQRGDPIRFCSLESVLQNAAFAKNEGIDLGLYPLTGSDGRLVAEVVLYGAIGADCQHPDLAYAFLRQFLTEEFQWETAVPGANMALDNRMLSGYPVRMEGSAGAYYQNLVQKAASAAKAMPWLEPELQNQTSMAYQLFAVPLEDEDLSILQREIDVARYPLPFLERDFGWEHTFRSFSDIPTEPDTDTAAAEFIRSLAYHLQAD